MYIGDLATARNKQILEENEIKAVVCCLSVTEFMAGEEHEDIEYCRVEVEDVSREPINLYFEEALDFIEGFVDSGESVLVHCRHGVSRSGTICLAYLMARCDFSLHQAFFFLRQRRNAITPNLGFMEQLCEYEVQMKGTAPTIDMFKYTDWYTGSFDISTSGSDKGAIVDLAPSD